VAASLGRKVPTSVAVAEGWYDAEQNEADGYLAVCVADKGPAVDMAISAADIAVQRAGVDASEFAVVMHACFSHQGMEHFAAASYLQSRTIQGSAMALELKQFSNGSLAMLELGAAYLVAQGRPSAALLTTSDRFAPPAYDRFRSDRGILYGDGGTALVLAGTPGERPVARLLSTHIVGDTRFGDLHIGSEPWSDAPGEGGWPLRLGARRDSHLELHGLDVLLDLMQVVAQRQRTTIGVALEDAGLASSDVRWWVLPNMGQQQVDWEFRRALGVEEPQTTWYWGRHVGHIGAGDASGGLCHLIETGAARPGDKVAMFGIGQGDNYGCAVVEILEEVSWESTAG
jgi:3-oxoacyl-[acyl-carrier-protein] synthase-3